MIVYVRYHFENGECVATGFQLVYVEYCSCILRITGVVMYILCVEQRLKIVCEMNKNLPQRRKWFFSPLRSFWTFVH